MNTLKYQRQTGNVLIKFDFFVATVRVERCYMEGSAIGLVPYC